MDPDRTFTPAEMAAHASAEDLYLVIAGTVYDCTKFAQRHPGGADTLLSVAGQDATEAFDDTGHSDQARKMLRRMQVGVLAKSSVSASTKATRASIGGAGSVAAWLVALTVLLCGLMSFRHLEMV
ncbi:cytochrome b5-like heme/steroid binding domain-containing protein [Plectosphaerella plurivora]|uniref:Cytochrome b5-like heme/steroid binding domain-containing protein n=1 Tax=Plectosphaerella plurivora TaxID=936078 RepID=A0A9P9AB00_9PEZI|nr:cytochrome b5-like heme/steroid binding domain-containing protein [Plectosphaerella plurivora]